jgi:hypothetical protein
VKHVLIRFLAALLSSVAACSDLGTDASRSPVPASDAELYRLVTETDPFTAYTLFPDVDSLVAGTLNGSTAHRPMVRVSLNARALGALHGGQLPNGASFPEGSVVFKQIVESGETTLYAVMLKASQHPYATGGWLWGEYRPGGTVAISFAERGKGCIGCHEREAGPLHDRVRTFERRK